MQPLAEIPLVLQTAYAELLERATTADFEQAFQEDGTFTVKTIRGRRYWYFQTPTKNYRRQRYVGPESEALLKQIAQHKKKHGDLRQRKTLVSTLVRSAYLQRADSAFGAVIAAMARAGVFRLRGVLIGTVAFQTYSAMLGVRLGARSGLTALRTGDIDIAQDRNISVAVGDKTEPLLSVLRECDPDFKEIPNLHRAHSAGYRNARLRVDVLTPNRGSDSDEPVRLRALGTDAQQLRFLDFLIRDPEPAVLLHEAGVLVRVPAPPRYAIHKLIVAQRRSLGSAKADKDLLQAKELLTVLAVKRQTDLRDVWQEASQRGKKWRELLLASLAQIEAPVRDLVLQVCGERRAALPGIALRFDDPRPAHDFARDLVAFDGESLKQPVRCAISHEALADHFGARSIAGSANVEAFRKHRGEIESLARQKYLHWPIERLELTLVKTEDVPKLRAEIASSARQEERSRV